MKNILTTFSIIIFLSINCFSCNNQKDNKTSQNDTPKIRKEYKVNLEKVAEKVKSGNKLSKNEILNIIPLSKEEFLIYNDYPQGKKKAYEMLDFEVFDMARNGDKDIFELYIKMAEFFDVKSSYGEGYFATIGEEVISFNQEKFCNLYPLLSNECQKRLVKYKAFCSKKSFSSGSDKEKKAIISRKDYEYKLSEVVKLINGEKHISNKEIIEIMPRTFEEYYLYCHFPDKFKELENQFYKLEKEIIYRAKKGEDGIFDLYMTCPEKS